jgi:type IV pilus assembly protein PilZ
MLKTLTSLVDRPRPLHSFEVRVSRELRKSPRLAVELAVDYQSDHNFYCGQTRNISLGGVFIASDSPLPLGTKLTVKLQLPVGRLSADGDVVWIAEAAPGSNGHSGMGIRFADLGDKQKAAIELFLKQREPMLYEEDPIGLDDGDSEVGVKRPRKGPPPLPGSAPARPPAPPAAKGHADDLDALVNGMAASLEAALKAAVAARGTPGPEPKPK